MNAHKDKIKELESDLTILRKVKAQDELKIASLAMDQLEKTLASPKVKKSLAALVNSVESSRDLEQDYEFFNVLTSLPDLSIFIDTDSEFQRDLFRQYMIENHYIDIDFKNDCALTSIGPCILINHNGDVLDQDSGKWILSKDDYESESELFKLIENHMQTTGYFPSIVACDYHGNANFVNTQKGEVK